MPEFDIDRALSGDATRIDWMNEACHVRGEGRYRHRDLTEDETGWDLPNASFGDYSGGTVERANSRSFKELFGDAIELEQGGHSSVTTWISTTSIQDMSDEKFEELKKVIESLDNYPVIDDLTLSEVELELENEAWEGWIEADFLKELHSWFSEEMDAHVEAYPQHEGIAELLDEHVYEIFRLTSPEYEHEQGGNVHVNIERLVHDLEWSAVLELLFPEDPRQLKFDLRTEGLVDKLLETDGPHSYSSTQINLPEELAEPLLAWSKTNIAEEDLFVDKDGGLGRETELHVTCKYGLTAAEPSEELLAILAATEPFEIKLGTVSLFTTNEDYDVVKLTVDSPGLRELNRQVVAACPNEDKYPTYQPHCTLAYVKKGRGAQFEGASPWESKGKMGQVPEDAGVFTADALVFSPSTDTDKLTLPLGEAGRA